MAAPTPSPALLAGTLQSSSEAPDVSLEELHPEAGLQEPRCFLATLHSHRGPLMLFQMLLGLPLWFQLRQFLGSGSSQLEAHLMPLSPWSHTGTTGACHLSPCTLPPCAHSFRHGPAICTNFHCFLPLPLPAFALLWLQGSLTSSLMQGWTPIACSSPSCVSGSGWQSALS